MNKEMQRRPGARNMGSFHRLAAGLGGGALLWLGLRRRSLGGLLAGLGGALLAYRSVTGRSPIHTRLGIDTTHEGMSHGIIVARAVTIERLPEALYRFWRELSNLPTFMEHLHRVEVHADGRSHWVARELGLKLSWDAEITEDIPGERIAWRSLPGGSVDTDGVVTFRSAPGNRGTEVQVRMRFLPPGGVLAMPLAPIFRRITREHVGRDLHRLKQIMETGEIATNAMRPGADTRRIARSQEPPATETREERVLRGGAGHERGIDEAGAQPSSTPSPAGITQGARP